MYARPGTNVRSCTYESSNLPSSEPQVDRRNDRNPTRYQKYIEGAKEIDFSKWRYWGDTSDWPRITFFEWRGIDSPETYYRCKFNLAFNYVINYYEREAAAQGITFQELATIAVTVTHFVERAATDYPTAEGRKSQVYEGEPKEFRPVPFGELFAVLGTNVHNLDYSTLLYEIESDSDKRFKVHGSSKYLPTFDFTAHSAFLILALSLLIELGVLHIEARTVPEDQDTQYFDSITPYDRRVSWFHELLHRYELLSEVHYTFTAQVGYSKLAYSTLVQHCRFATDCLGFSQFDIHTFNDKKGEDVAEQNFNFDTHRPIGVQLYTDQLAYCKQH